MDIHPLDFDDVIAGEPEDDYREMQDFCIDCGRGEDEDGKCPLCCGNSFAPGTEECDLCEFTDECATGYY